MSTATSFELSEYNAGSVYYASATEGKAPISNEKIRLALNKLYSAAVIKAGNLAEVTEKAAGAKITVKYYTCRQTAGSRLPWYAISEAQLTRLEEDGIRQIVLIFWEQQEHGTSAPTFLCPCAVGTVRKHWSKETGSQTYRLNFHEAESDGKKTYVSGQYTFAPQDTGTVMSREAEIL